MAKKKANPQSEDNKPSMDVAASEKLESLKSLNAMLLKETMERRQQVESLTKINNSLESELTRYKSDNVSLQSELNGLTEQAVMFEIEKGLVSRFVASQVNEMAEVNRTERVAMEEKIGGLKRDMNWVLDQKNKIEKAMNMKESEICSLKNKLSSLVTEIGEEKFVLSKVCEERDGIMAQLDDQIEFENTLRSKLAEAEKREALIKVDYDGLVQEKTSIERKMDSIVREKAAVESYLVESNGLVDELKRDIKKIVIEKMAIEEQKNDLQDSVDHLKKLVHRLEEGEEQLLEKVVNLETNYVMNLEKEAQTSMEIDVLVKEKQEINRKLSEEKSAVTKDLNAALKMMEHHKLTIDQMIKEKTKIEEQLVEFKNTSAVQINKLKQLEAKVSHYKAAFDQATTERNNSHVNLNEEQLKVKNLSEKISNMEKGIEETRKNLSKTTKVAEKLAADNKNLEITRSALAGEVLSIKKSLSKALKEHDDTKCKLHRSEAKLSQILEILKTTSMICNSNEDDDMGTDQETEFGEELKHHVTEIETIKKAFKAKESIVEELKKQLESLKACLAKADKGKSFWTMVSSATTIIAAVSLAYVARGY